MCGGGGSSSPTQQTVTQTTIPDWAKPYATKVLGEAENLAYNQPYQSYGGQRLAGLNPLQEQAYMGIQQSAPASQIGQATGLAGMAGLQAQQAGQYRAARPTNFYNPMDVNYLGTSTGQFGGSEAGQYMSPYMQNVVEQQKQQAVQDYSRQIPGLQAQGIRVGARGGTREALLQSEAQRNLMNQLGGIQAQGSQQAFQQGQQQYNVDASRALQAQQANQQAQLQAQQQALGQRGAMAQYGLGGQQLAESSRQFGAGLGIQGIQQQLAAAGQLGQLGQTQFGQQQAANQAQMLGGQQLQQMEQQRLDQAYQEFLAQQRYPYTQLGFVSDIIRGTPSSSAVSTLYQAPPSAFGQVAGAGLGLAGLYGAMKG
jgi:hypothetical protein